MLTIITALAFERNVTIVINMCDYSFFADALNKYSQFTPAIQAVLAVSFCGMMVGFAYFGKECVVAVMKPFSKHVDGSSETTGEKREWQDKYYRGEAAQ